MFNQLLSFTEAESVTMFSDDGTVETAASAAAGGEIRVGDWFEGQEWAGVSRRCLHDTRKETSRHEVCRDCCIFLFMFPCGSQLALQRTLA
jgi:hypothetical protein